MRKNKCEKVLDLEPLTSEELIDEVFNRGELDDALDDHFNRRFLGTPISSDVIDVLVGEKSINALFITEHKYAISTLLGLTVYCSVEDHVNAIRDLYNKYR